MSPRKVRNSNLEALLSEVKAPLQKKPHALLGALPLTDPCWRHMAGPQQRTTVLGTRSAAIQSPRPWAAKGAKLAPSFTATDIPELSLGRRRSRGRPLRQGKAPPSRQRVPTAPADLPAQRLRAQVPAAALEPAILPGSGMPAAGPPLAGGAAASQTSPGRPRQSPARPGRKSAPPASQVRAPGR